jgi:hypothetical protein
LTNLKRTFKIGSDPELFIHKDGAFVNAYHHLGKIVHGTKAAPECTSYGAIQVDGMAIELNTEPTADPKHFAELIKAGLIDTATRFGGVISPESVEDFTIEFLEDQHPLSIELGCTPDYDAWRDGAKNKMPDMFAPFRTAGGHVHIGWRDEGDAYDRDHLAACCAAVRQMDYVLGLWSLGKDTKGARRRQLYGKAGAFRPKFYGVEYRVLSNFWVFDPALCEEVVKRTVAGMRLLDEAGGDGCDFTEHFGEAARTAITTGKVDPGILDAVESVVQAAM